jgi:hypothetical protein
MPGVEQTSTPQMYTGWPAAMGAPVSSTILAVTDFMPGIDVSPPPYVIPGGQVAPLVALVVPVVVAVVPPPVPVWVVVVVAPPAPPAPEEHAVSVRSPTAARVERDGR